MQNLIEFPTSFECSSFSKWNDAVCETFVALDCQRSDCDRFWGKIERRKLFDLPFIEVSAYGHTAIRDTRNAAKSDDDFFLLSILHQGEMTIVQRDRTAKLMPGDFAIYDTSEAYQILLNKPFVQSVLKIRRRDITDRVLNASHMTARRITADRGIGHIASNFIRLLSAQLNDIDPQGARQLRTTLLDLVCGAFKELEGELTLPSTESQNLFLHRILQFVEDNLHDENLSCETIAQALGVSGRYLRKLFEGRKQSLSQWIWCRRLDEARRALADFQSVQRSMTAIAYDLGYKDPAHFSKAFKAKFGQTPREFRQMLFAESTINERMPLQTNS